MPMHRLGANVAATAAPLLLAAIVGHCLTSPELPLEVIAAILVDLVLWGAVACRYLASRIGGARETADPQAWHYGDNVIPLPVMDSETADAVRRINRRLASGNGR
ncbi:hypothetical protein [Micromonospora carbonacea]|uniref:hypothetical protein n=1 Tax=Micromonospora carbonacea TaxID=47853 RepID=UPI003403EAFD